AAVAVVGVAAFVFIFQDIETPAYRVVQADGDVELRDYPALVVAEIERRGTRRQAVQRGFGPLAGYIFARGRPGDRIAMTAPVTQRRRGEDAPLGPATAWVVRFIMPAEYRIEDLPSPGSPEVQLRDLPASCRAAVRFSGVAGDDDFSAREATLRSWLSERGLPSDGTVEYAYYNDPITPGFLRRNEVLIDLPRDAACRRGSNDSG
ncbi:MAG: heme-binding protein, partial [Pseudomonadota bacterium]